MNEFYYSAEPTSAHAEREIEIEALGVRSRCLTDAGVFSRDGLDTGTRAMLEALPELPFQIWKSSRSRSELRMAPVRASMS